MTDRQKVESLLKLLDFDPDDTALVLAACAADKEARLYWTERYDNEVTL